MRTRYLPALALAASILTACREEKAQHSLSNPSPQGTTSAPGSQQVTAAPQVPSAPETAAQVQPPPQPQPQQLPPPQPQPKKPVPAPPPPPPPISLDDPEIASQLQVVSEAGEVLAVAAADAPKESLNETAKKARTALSALGKLRERLPETDRTEFQAKFEKAREKFLVWQKSQQADQLKRTRAALEKIRVLSSELKPKTPPPPTPPSPTPAANP